MRSNAIPSVSIPVGKAAALHKLDGELLIPENALGLVVFVHGSGSNRMSRRNRYVADALYGYGLATLLIDLLTPEEEQLDSHTRALRFDIVFLEQRLLEVIDFLKKHPDSKDLHLGVFGANTGAACAIGAAASRPNDVKAVVSRGGRPDLALDRLPSLRAPTLLIVGGEDAEFLRLNESALEQMTCTKELAVIKGATHSFEEAGALEQVAVEAQVWFARYLK